MVKLMSIELRTHIALRVVVVSDVVEKTSTRRRSRIPCVVVEKSTTRRSEDGGVVNKKCNKKLSYRRGTARRAVTVKTVRNITQIFVELHLISPALGE